VAHLRHVSRPELRFSVDVGEPTALSSRLRSRNGTSRDSAIASNASRLGCARPVSMKLMWRAEKPACIATSS
jgi:hypothetical protein